MGSSDEPTTRVPYCPRCGYDLRGETAKWQDACPLEGRCTECGLIFRWQFVLGRVHALPRWCLESPTRRFGPLVLASTLSRTLTPGRFWRDLQLWHRFNGRRLVGFVAVLCIVGAFMASLSVGLTVIDLIHTNPHPTIRAHGVPTQQAQPFEEFLAVTYAMVFPLAEEFPRLLQRRHSALSRYGVRPVKALDRVVPAFFLAGWSVLGLTLTTASFAALPITRRRAKVQWRHIGRVCVYGMGLTFLFVLFMLAMTIVWVTGAAGMAGLPTWRMVMNAADTWMVAFVLLIGWQVYWWWAAVSRYLRMPHAPAVAIILVLLGWFAVFTGFFFTATMLV